jgi:hypothetical protein
VRGPQTELEIIASDATIERLQPSFCTFTHRLHDIPNGIIFRHPIYRCPYVRCRTDQAGRDD